MMNLMSFILSICSIFFTSIAVCMHDLTSAEQDLIFLNQESVSVDEDDIRETSVFKGQGGLDSAVLLGEPKKLPDLELSHFQASSKPSKTVQPPKKTIKRKKPKRTPTRSEQKKDLPRYFLVDGIKYKLKISNRFLAKSYFSKDKSHHLTVSDNRYQPGDPLLSIHVTFGKTSQIAPTIYYKNYPRAEIIRRNGATTLQAESAMKIFGGFLQAIQSDNK